MELIPTAVASPTSRDQAVLAPCLPGAGVAAHWHRCLRLDMWARGPACAGPATLGTHPPGEGVHPLSITRL